MGRFWVRELEDRMSRIEWHSVRARRLRSLCALKELDCHIIGTPFYCMISSRMLWRPVQGISGPLDTLG